MNVDHQTTQYHSKMKCFLVFALVALVAARPDDGNKPKPRPPHRGPAIFVKPVHFAAQNETYEFKFGIAGMRPLNTSEVRLWKIVKGEKGPEFKETDFDIKMKTLTEEEIKEWMDEHKDDDRRPKPKPHPRPHPRPHFKHAIVGKVSVSSVSCDNQGPYLIRYGERPDDEDEDDRRPHPKPHPKPRGAFFLKVKGCPRPKPRDA